MIFKKYIYNGMIIEHKENKKAKKDRDDNDSGWSIFSDEVKCPECGKTVHKDSVDAYNIKVDKMCLDCEVQLRRLARIADEFE